jgi:N-acetylglucosaminyldiphosphoundecaprenol N-acetyl-beta-D-mannosaminyltransferase
MTSGKTASATAISCANFGQMPMRVDLLGCPVDILTMTETVELARSAIRHRKRLQHVALNVAKLVNARSNPELAADVAGSDIVGADGMGIVLAAQLLGIPLKERVAGVDLCSNSWLCAPARGTVRSFLAQPGR